MKCKNLSDVWKQFKYALRNYLYAYTFYSVKEYFNINIE